MIYFYAEPSLACMCLYNIFVVESFFTLLHLIVVIRICCKCFKLYWEKRAFQLHYLHKESSFLMEPKSYINLTFLVVVNVCFFFSGICLNSLVIISFWRSAQLRRKLCYFMIMVLSCFDFILVLTNQPTAASIAILWLRGNISALLALNSVDFIYIAFIGFSLLALLVMNFDRYFATYYPIFHRTSVTKRRLLCLLGLLIVLEVVLVVFWCTYVISYQLAALIFLVIIVPPMSFVNYKLFAIAKNSRNYCRKGTSIGTRKVFSLKGVSSCLLAVACFLLLSIPMFVYIGLRMNSIKKPLTLDDAHLVGIWAKTIGSMNGTFNCLIFYWKNKILRVEGMKVIKTMAKIGERVRS